ncbi:MAG: hypothetical protein AB7E76_09355 [Deferribacterales bacterium]
MTSEKFGYSEKSSKEIMHIFWKNLQKDPKNRKFLFFYIMISEKQCFTSNESFMHILEMIPALTPEQEIKDLYIELLAVIKKIMPDTGLTNKEELVNNCLENPELITSMTEVAKEDRDYYDALKEVIRIYIEDVDLDVSQIPFKTQVAFLDCFSETQKAPISKKKNLIRTDYRKAFSVWALNAFFGINPTRNDKTDRNTNPCGCDFVADAENCKYGEIKELWFDHKFKFYRMSEIEDISYIIKDKENNKTLFSLGSGLSK